MTERHELRITPPPCDCLLPEGEFGLGGLHQRRLADGTTRVKVRKDGSLEVCPRYYQKLEAVQRARQRRSSEQRSREAILDV